MRQPPKQIYFIKPVGKPGPIKIGCSRFVGSRLAHLMDWSPVPLEMIACADGETRLEFCIHRMFAAQRLRKEWFDPSPLLIECIERVKRGAPIVEAFNIEIGSKTRWGRREATYSHISPQETESA